uniref:Uncharacterized protein n=1 Tax=Anguilla anguilla TaxID=7936 RepID=A0A0E9Q0G3_ANGAN
MAGNIISNYLECT